MKAARDSKQNGHEDARCLFFRQHRFRAIALPERISEKSLLTFRKEKKIPDRDLVFEFSKKNSSDVESFNFPVSRRHVVVQNAKECSHLLFKVPEGRINWVYVSPQYDLLLVDFLETKES
jgi:hypothetical protein